MSEAILPPASTPTKSDSQRAVPCCGRAALSRTFFVEPDSDDLGIKRPDGLAQS